MTSNLKEKDSTINNNSENSINSSKQLDQPSPTSSQLPNSCNASSMLTSLDTINSSLLTPEFDADIPPEILQQAFKARLGYSQKSQLTAFKPTNNTTPPLNATKKERPPLTVNREIISSSMDNKSVNESSKLVPTDHQSSSANYNTMKSPLKYQQAHIKRLHSEMDDWKTWLNKTYEQSPCLQQTELKINNPANHLKLINQSKNHQRQRPVVEFLKTPRTKNPKLKVNAQVQTNNNNQLSRIPFNSVSAFASTTSDPLLQNKIKNKPLHTLKNKIKDTQSSHENFNKYTVYTHHRSVNTTFNNNKISNINITTNNVDISNSIRVTNNIINSINSTKHFNEGDTENLIVDLMKVVSNLDQVLSKIYVSSNKGVGPSRANKTTKTATVHAINKIQSNDSDSTNSTSNSSNEDDMNCTNNITEYSDDEPISNDYNINKLYKKRKINGINPKKKDIIIIDKDDDDGDDDDDTIVYIKNDNRQSHMEKKNKSKKVYSSNKVNSNSNFGTRYGIMNRFIHNDHGHFSNNKNIYTYTDDNDNDELQNDYSIEDEDDASSFHTADSDSQNDDNVNDIESIKSANISIIKNNDLSIEGKIPTTSRFSLLSILNKFTSRSTPGDDEKYIVYHDPEDERNTGDAIILNGYQKKQKGTSFTPKSASRLLTQQEKLSSSEKVKEKEKGKRTMRIGKKRGRKKITSYPNSKSVLQIDNGLKQSKQSLSTNSSNIPLAKNSNLPTKRPNNNNNPNPTASASSKDRTMNKYIKLLDCTIEELTSPHTCEICKEENIPQYILDKLEITDQYIKDLKKTKDLRPLGHTGSKHYWDPQVFIRCIKCKNWYHCGCASPPVKNFPEPHVKYQCGDCDSPNIFSMETPPEVFEPRKRTKVASYRV